MARTLRLTELPVTGWLALGGIVGLAVVILLRGSFRPFGFLMDTLLLLVISVGVLYVWILFRRPGHGPASENMDDVLAVAKEKFEQGEISADEYGRIKGNVED